MTASTHTQPRRVAVFDFDGTTIDGQSGSLFTRYLLSHGLMSPLRLARLVWWGARYKLHLPYRQDEARELVFGSLAGRTSEEVDAVMTGFHDEVLAPLYRPQALDEVAYVRFASVYRQFRDIQTFRDELNKLLSDQI